MSSYSPGDLTFRRLAGCAVRQVWPLLAFLGALVVAAGAWFVRSDDAVPLTLFGRLALFATFGLVGSFSVHEFAHVLALRRTPGIARLTLERSAWRFSVLAHGSLSVGAAIKVALAGPLACAAIGLVIWPVPPLRGVAWCYLAHLFLLAPCFGDGRVLVRAIVVLARSGAGGAGPRRAAGRARGDLTRS